MNNVSVTIDDRDAPTRSSFVISSAVASNAAQRRIKSHSFAADAIFDPGLNLVPTSRSCGAGLTLEPRPSFEHPGPRRRVCRFHSRRYMPTRANVLERRQLRNVLRPWILTVPLNQLDVPWVATRNASQPCDSTFKLAFCPVT